MADERELVMIHDARTGTPFMLSVREMRAKLEAHGLHVVTAADKAVLDACAEKSDSTLRLVQGRMRDVARAELARREQKT